jgi:hypothetical protein
VPLEVGDEGDRHDVARFQAVEQLHERLVLVVVRAGGEGVGGAVLGLDLDPEPRQ